MKDNEVEVEAGAAAQRWRKGVVRAIGGSKCHCDGLQRHAPRVCGSRTVPAVNFVNFVRRAVIFEAGARGPPPLPEPRAEHHVRLRVRQRHDRAVGVSIMVTAGGDGGGRRSR